MKHINQLAKLPPPVPNNIRGPRDEGIQRFIDKRCIKIHDSKTKRLRLVTPQEPAIILAPVPTDELYRLYQGCEQARSFWWAIRA